MSDNKNDLSNKRPDMKNNANIDQLADDVLDRVAGGYGMQGAECPCGETDLNQFSIVSKGPETMRLHCRTCGKDFYHRWEE